MWRIFDFEIAAVFRDSCFRTFAEASVNVDAGMVAMTLYTIWDAYFFKLKRVFISKFYMLFKEFTPIPYIFIVNSILFIYLLIPLTLV